MRQVTNEFKNEIKKYSRQIKGVLKINGETADDEKINSVSLVTLGNLLKSCMREMDVITSEEIHKDDILHFEFGVKVRDNGENDYDFIDYGNFIVAKEPEIQEDKETYRIVCYDKMINTMKDYESLKHGTFPMTIRDFINNLCLDCDLEFKNVNDTFVNYNRILQNDPYAGLNYTYRDIFDELAQVTASTICIDMETDKLEIRYITDSGVELDEESFRDINVNFDNSMKPINTIVLSRSAGADRIAQSIPADLPDEQKNAIEISDNQIMNFDDRGDYVPEILNKLYGLSFALNDFESTGICYLDLCDKYSVKIRDNNYDCVLLNDDIRITTGISEKIYTENIEGTDTDYSKTDKIDQKVNKISLIVDKQQGIIEGLVSKIIDISTEKDTLVARMTFENINESEPFSIKVHPLNKNISYLYPFNGLYPSDDLYMTSRTLRFLNTTTNEAFDLELPDDLLYYDEDNYDEFVLDYPTKKCYVVKKCKYTADGSVELLSESETTYYDYPLIHLTSGNYTVMLLAMNTGYIYAKLMLKNDFTSQMVTDINMSSRLTETAESIESEVSANYATKTELGTTETTLNSRITETASEISTEVSKKVGEDEVISKINQSAEQVAIDANKISLDGKTIDLTAENININSTNFKVDKNGKITSTSGKIGGFDIGEHTLSSELTNDLYHYTETDHQRVISILNGSITPTSDDYEKYDFDKNGEIDTLDLLTLVRYLNINIFSDYPGEIIINNNNEGNQWQSVLRILDGSKNPLVNLGTYSIIKYLDTSRISAPEDGYYVSTDGSSIVFSHMSSNGRTISYLQDVDTYMTVTRNDGTVKGITWWDSDIRLKKEIEDTNEKGLEIISKIKHHEFIKDGKKYKIGYIAQELEKIDKDLVFEVGEDKILNINTPVLIPYMTKAIQEQQKQIEELEKRIKILEGRIG